MMIFVRVARESHFFSFVVNGNRGGDICQKCWVFMIVAIKIIDAALRQDFGFQHLLWVYSGRRGVHCWVADVRARKLSADARKAIIGWLEVIKVYFLRFRVFFHCIKGGSQQARKVNLPNKLVPSLEYPHSHEFLRLSVLGELIKCVRIYLSNIFYKNNIFWDRKNNGLKSCKLFQKNVSIIIFVFTT